MGTESIACRGNPRAVDRVLTGDVLDSKTVIRRFANAIALAAAVLMATPALAADATRDSRKAYLKARVAMSDGRYRDALEQYRRVLALVPEDAVVRYEYAQLLRDLNVPDEALKQAREAVRLDPNLPEARRLLGTLEFASSDQDPAALDRAIEQLTAARRLSPYDTSAAVSLAKALLARGRAADAARILDDLPEGRSQPSLIRLTAEARAKAGRLKEAETLYLSLREADPKDRESTAALIDIYEEQDKMDKALELLAELQKRDPENPGDRRADHARPRARRPFRRGREARAGARREASREPRHSATARLRPLRERGRGRRREDPARPVAADADDERSRRTLAGELIRERRFARRPSPARGVRQARRRRSQAARGAASGDGGARPDRSAREELCRGARQAGAPGPAGAGGQREGDAAPALGGPRVRGLDLRPRQGGSRHGRGAPRIRSGRPMSRSSGGRAATRRRPRRISRSSERLRRRGGAGAADAYTASRTTRPRRGSPATSRRRTRRTRRPSFGWRQASNGPETARSLRRSSPSCSRRVPPTARP